MPLSRDFVEACKNGDLNKVKALHKQGSGIHVGGDLALRGAIYCGHLDVVKYLVERGVDIHVDYEYALRWAVFYKQPDVVKYLVKHGANIHALDNQALRWAAEYGHLNVVNLLREAAGARYKCHGCLIKSTCLELCEDFRTGEE